MNEDEKRHIAGAIRNNLIHHGPFEPVTGHSFAWRDGKLYRLPAGAPAGAEAGLQHLLTAEEVYGLDDEALHARAMGEAAPEPAPEEVSEEESPAAEEEEAPAEEESAPEPPRSRRYSARRE